MGRISVQLKYHLTCWVENVQHGIKNCSENGDDTYTLHKTKIGIIASDIEFVLNMTDLKIGYPNGVHQIMDSE